MLRCPDWRRVLPPYWFQNAPTSRNWDRMLNLAIDAFGVTNVQECTCQVGPFTVWIANWPYAYGSNYGVSQKELPTVRTRKRLRSAIYQDEARKLVAAIREMVIDNPRRKLGDTNAA